MRTLPESFIYTHTHNFLRQHQHLVPEPPSDFAVWAKQGLQDPELAESLAAIDTVSYAELKELRESLLKVLEKHLKSRGPGRTVPAGQEFPFLRSIRFSLPTPYMAWDLAEFAEGLGKASPSSLYLHIFEARLRPPLGVNDFSAWLERELGEKALSRKISRLDPYSHTLDGLRRTIVRLAEQRLEELSHA